MSRIFKPAYVVIFLLSTLLIGLGALVAAYALAPAYIENRLIPGVAADMGISEFSLRVRRVGIFGADLEKIRVGSESEPSMVIDEVQIDYSPSDLLNKTVRQVVIQGAQLSCGYRNGRLTTGEDLRAMIDALSAAGEKNDQKPPSPLPFKRLALRHASVHLQTGGIQLTVPFELDLLPDRSTGRQLTLNAVMRPRGQRLEAVVKSDLESGRTAVRITAAALQLNVFADIAGALEGLQPGGRLKIDTAADLAFAPFEIFAAEATLQWSGKGIKYRNMHFEPAVPVAADRPGWRLKARTAGGGRWHVSADPLLAASEIIFRISALEAHIEPSSAGYEIAGQLKAEPLGFKAGGRFSQALSLAEKPLVGGIFNAAVGPRANWEFTLEGTPLRPGLQLETAAGSLSASMGAFRLSASGEPGRLSAQCTAAASDLRLRNHALMASAASLAFEGKAAPPGEQGADISFSLSNVGGEVGDIELSGAMAGFDGTVRSRETSGFQIFGMTRFSVGELTAASGSARIRNAGGKMPLSWPPPAAAGAKAGFFNIARLSFRNWNLSGIRGNIRQTAGGFSLNGRHTDAVIPGMTLDFNGRGRLIGAGAPAVEFSANATRPGSAAPIELATLLPGGKGMLFSGALTAELDLRVDAAGAAGKSALRLTDGLLRASRENFKISGIQMGIEIPDLATLRSAPGQQLSFADARLGDIELKKGLVVFQIEPAPAVLLERGQFDWSGGRVDMHSTRIFLDREDYSLTLFCDRLNLASLLGEFGVADAEGEGTVSGKIPVRYRNGKWSVERGFLYSSPGEGGKIRLEDTEILTAGIPTGSTQYVQMEIAREALKNYNFSWAKLAISTEGEDMLLKLQLDGKPATTLPFEFRKDVGSFVRVDGQSRGSEFQGIRLDVNFRLPLNKILEYRSIIQLIRNKGVK